MKKKKDRCVVSQVYGVGVARVYQSVSVFLWHNW